MNKVYLNSSAVNWVDYDEKTHVMHINFHQGDTYPFCGVPLSIYEGLINATSSGKFYNDYIKDRYNCY